MSHANARLNVFGRRLLVERVLAGHRPAEVAKQLGVSRATVYKWVRRFRAEGLEGLVDRSSRPHRSPRQVPTGLAARIVAARRDQHVGARELSALLGVPASTIGAVLRRAGVPHLAHLDRLTGELVRGRRHSDLRYEHDRPGSCSHVDVKKLGKIPPGGGWRVHGRREQVSGRGLGWDYVHVAVDDHTRLAYAEVLPDERATTCAQFLHRACQRAGSSSAAHHPYADRRRPTLRPADFAAPRHVCPAEDEARQLAELTSPAVRRVVHQIRRRGDFAR